MVKPIALLEPLELVCFDLDGTLVDSRRDIERSLAHALAEVPPADAADRERDAQALASAGLGLSLEEFFAIARPSLDAAEDAAAARARFVAAYRRHYHEHLLDETRPFDGVMETLAALTPLRARGLRTAVATTKRSDTARRVVAGLGLDGYFDLVLGTDGIPHKPAPDVLLLAARSVERAPARGLMIGDNARDVQAGRAAGMKTCAVSWGTASPVELRAHAPDYVIDRFAEVVGIVNGLTNPQLV